MICLYKKDSAILLLHSLGLDSQATTGIEIASLSTPSSRFLSFLFAMGYCLATTFSVLATLCAMLVTTTSSAACQCAEKSNRTEASTPSLKRPFPEGGVRTGYHFATPLVRTNLEAFVPNITAFNNALTENVMMDYADFLKWTETVSAAEDAEERNNDFFRYQVGFEDEMSEEEASETEERAENMLFRRCYEFSKLHDVVSAVARHAVTKVLGGRIPNVDAEDTEVDSDAIEVSDFDVWATVHFENAQHAMHFHEGSVLAAVYYVSVPSGAGKLTLYDPRGPRPPFEENIVIRPRAGDLIMFPGWLGHSVSATGDTDGKPRISIPFNLAGEWESSAKVPAKGTEVSASEVAHGDKQGKGHTPKDNKRFRDQETAAGKPISSTRREVCPVEDLNSETRKRAMTELLTGVQPGVRANIVA